MKKNDDELSILGYGCMRLPQKKGSPGDGKIDDKRATTQIRMAIDEGVNYIDTAYPYHMATCEPFLSRALSDGYRAKVKLATKLPRWIVKEKGEMDTILNSQLNRLKTDQIDYYLIHALDDKSWQKMEAMGAGEFLDRAKTDGRIANAGFSFHGDRKSFTAIVDAYDWDFCQIQYNFLDQQNQAGTKGLKYAASKKMGVIVMEGSITSLLAVLTGFDKKNCKKVKKVLDNSFDRQYSTIKKYKKQVIKCNRNLPRHFVVKSLARIN